MASMIYQGETSYVIEAPSVRAELTPGAAVPEALFAHVPEEDTGLFAKAMSASSAAEEEAQARGIDLGQVEGTGKGGRILKSDVAAYTPE